MVPDTFFCPRSAVWRGRRDILIGFDGDDVLEGGDQEDALFGGLGDDVLLGGEAKLIRNYAVKLALT